MKPEERETILKYVTGSIGLDELKGVFGNDSAAFSARAKLLLEDAAKRQDADDVEFALALVSVAGIEREVVALLNDLITEEWHMRHDDIAFSLETQADPSSANPLYQAALMQLPYLDYSETYPLARKCIWGLSRIGSSEAIEYLKQLAQNENPAIAGYASKRLAESQ